MRLFAPGLRRLALAIVLGLAAAFPAYAGQWMDVATISSTLGNNSGRLCIGGGRTDLGCPADAPLLNSATGLLTVPGDLRVIGNLYVSGSQSIDGVSFANGGVSATGTISATIFSGSGAGLNNIPASAVVGLSTDRIVSTSANVIVGTDGLVHFSTGGVTNTAFLDTNGRLINAGISTTGPISGTSGYFNALKMGSAVTSIPTPVAEITSDTNNISGIGMRNTNAGGNAEFRFAVTDNLNTSNLAFTMPSSANSNTPLFGISRSTQASLLLNSSTSRDLTMGTFTTGNFILGTNNAERLRITTAGLVGIGTLSPSTSLHVSGTLRIANGGEACDTSRLGAIRYASGSFSICQNTSNGWESLATTGANSLADRITSNSQAGVIANATGYISLTTGGVTGTAYFTPGAVLVNTGISTTGPISATSGYFGGNVGINTSIPSAPLDVSGTGAFKGLRVSDTTASVVSIDVNSTSTSGNSRIRFGHGTGYQMGVGREGNNGAIDYTAKLFVRMGSPSNSSNPTVMMLDNNQNMGVGIVSTALVMAKLDVSGTIKMADSGETCDSTHLGAIKYLGGDFYVCRNSATGWESLTSVANGAAALADRITSGTTQAITYNNTSLSLVTAGTERMVIGTAGNVGIGMQPTANALSVSGTFLTTPGSGLSIAAYSYSSNTSILNVRSTTGGPVSVLGLDNPTQPWQIRNENNILSVFNPVTISYPLNIVSTGLIGIGTTTPAAQFDVVSSSTAADVLLGHYSSQAGSGFSKSTIRIEKGATYGGEIAGYVNQGLNGGLTFSVLNGAAASSEIMRITGSGFTSGRIGVGTSTPTTILDVSGTLKIAYGNESCATSTLGAIKYQSGDFYVCRNGTAWESLTSVGNSSTPDRIVSGTVSAIANGAMDTISFTTNASKTTYINSAGNFVAQNLTNGTNGTKSILGADGGLVLTRPTDATASNINGYIDFYDQTANYGRFFYNSVSRTFTLTNTTGDVNLLSTNIQASADNLSGASLASGKGLYVFGSPTVTRQGGYIGWNIIPGDGRTHFMNNRGGGTGGFVFSNMNLDNSYQGTPILTVGDVVGNRVGINIPSNTAPNTTLDVSGSIRLGKELAANGNNNCDTSRLGAIKYDTGQFYVCRNTTTGWETLTAGGTVGAIDDLSDAASNIVSGSVYLGSGSGTSATSAIHNTAVGLGSMAQTTSGGSNIAVGFNALNANTTGSNNLAVGSNALNTNTTGNGNAAFGLQSINFNVSGTRNVGLGNFALQFSTGSSNTAVGYNAGGPLTAGDGNLFLGAQTTPFSTTGSNQLNIGNAIWGDLKDNSTPLAARIGINVTSPTANLEVSGTISATRFVGDGSGLTGVGGGTPDRITSNTTQAIAYKDTSISLVTAGTERMVVGTTGNVGIGAQPDPSFTLYINQSARIAGGYLDIYSGVGNVAVGGNAIFGTGAGPAIQQRTALGYFAGSGATGRQLVAVGAYAGQGNSGMYTTMVGGLSGSFNTANYLTAVGNNSAVSNTGLNVTALGYNSGYLNTYNNVVLLGANTSATKDNQVVLGSSATVEVTTTGVILAPGVSTTNVTLTTINGQPLSALGSTDRITSGTTQAIAYTNTSISLVTAGTERMVIGTTGNVGIAQQPVSGLALSVSGSSAIVGRLGLLTATGNNVFVGNNAGSFNTGSNVAGFGLYNLGNNTGSSAAAFGDYTAQNNTGANLAAFGMSAGYNNTGGNSTLLGFQAGQYNTGGNIVAVGYNAAQSNTQPNIAVLGYQAAQFNTGSALTAIGEFAGMSNTGVNNVLLGYSAGSSNSGNYASVMGAFAGQYNTGSNLTAVGNSAGQYNTGVSNTALGYLALNNGVSNTFTNVTALGANAQPTMSNQVVLGDTNIAQVFSYGAGVFNKYVRMGSATTVSLPAAATAGAGAIMYDATSNTLAFSNGTIWQPVGSGAGGGASTFTALTDVSASTPAGNIFGPGSLTGATSAVTQTTAFGQGALAAASNSGFNNSAFGSLALNHNTTGHSNAAFGYNALITNTSGNDNVAVGQSALYATTSGGDNVAIGFNAALLNNTGNNNVAIGSGALYGNNTGNNNTAIGTGSMASNKGAANTALGNNALNTQAGGTQNVAIGNSAMSGVGTGTGNTGIGSSVLASANSVTNTTAIGYQSGLGTSSSSYQNGTYLGAFSGLAVTTGSSNTLIGYNAGAGITTGANNLILGASTSPLSNTADNQLNIANAIMGNYSLPLAAKIGINVTSPTTALQVSGTVSTNAAVQAGNADTTCASSADYGKMRFDSTTSRLYLCRP